MAKFTRTFVKDNEEMSVQADSFKELEQVRVQLEMLGWSVEKNNWSGLVMATPTQQKPVTPSVNGCPHHPGKMRPDKDGKGGMYCSAKLPDDRWCGFSTKPDGTMKRPSRLDRPVQPVLKSEDEIDF
jgi:hypothetical protein